MPKSPEQYDDIRKQRKQLIMDTALELFAENGFHATSISQIAGKAKISKGLTYNYFASKNEILEEIMAHGFHVIYDNMDLNRDGVLSEKEFISFISHSFRQVRENKQYWKLFFALMLQPRVTLTYASLYEKQGLGILQMFNEFIISSGSRSPESDLMAIKSMVEGAFLYLVTAPEVFDHEKLEESVIKNCIKIIQG